MSSPRVKVPAAYTVVLDHLRREIQLSRVAAGERFPPEREHAKELGVSRVTLREALRVLEGEGLIEVRRGAGGGATVREPERGARTRPNLELEEVLALQEFRGAIEPLAARRAATRGDGRQRARLEAAVSGLSDVTDVGAFRALDSAFHLTVAEMADCAPLLEAVERTRIAMFEPVDMVDHALILPTTQRAHARILTAIVAGDAARAAREMTRHITAVTGEIQDFYGSL